jgi:hypothetical protein
MVEGLRVARITLILCAFSRRGLICNEMVPLRMRAIQGQVVDGRVVPGEKLRNGSAVTIIVEDEELPDLTDADVAELASARDEIRAGEYVTANQVFEHLRRKRA